MPVMAIGSHDSVCTEVRQRSRLSWAELMRRVFALDVLECPVCRGPMKIIADITQPKIIERFLAALDLPAEHPEIERAHATRVAHLGAMLRRAWMRRHYCAAGSSRRRRAGHTGADGS